MPTPGTEIVSTSADTLDSTAARAALGVADLAVGATSRAARLALRLGTVGLGAGAALARTASTMPGAAGTARMLSSATRPLVSEGQALRSDARTTAQADAQRLIDALVPRVIDALDVERLVSRIDIDKLVRRIEIDDLVSRIDIDQLVRRIEMDDLVRRVDVNDIVQRVDVDQVVEQTELGTIVARSTSGFATEALDSARSQTAGLDTLVSRAVNRALRRKEGEVPAGPPLLTGEGAREDAPAGPGVEPAPPRSEGGESE